MVKKFFQRYFESEFSAEDKFFSLTKKEDAEAYNGGLKHILRHIANTTPIELSWRKHRSYLVVNKCSYNAEVRFIHKFRRPR
jgi:hypothetical protein